MTSFFATLRRVLLRSRTIVGLGLIAASVVGVFTYIRISTPGDGMVLASQYLAAGTVVTEDMVVEGRASSRQSIDELSLDDVIGRTVGVDVGPGEMMTNRMFETTAERRIELAVPLGVNPPDDWSRGREVSLWAIDGEGVLPPRAVANNATVLAFADGGFGAETIATVLVNPSDVDRILAMIGTTTIIVATSSEIS